ncbi:MAG TPA: vanadium-dependent haloperoxidase [Allosphingosinicella sp.]|nr:vanadium-dependent haloperoxidase [Allosphingosinicella sp.]
MANLHQTRRNRINKIRDKIDRIRDDRRASNFTDMLSGVERSGDPDGPYQGLRWLPLGARHENNNDENRPDFAGNFSKGLRHNPLEQGGLVEREDYKDFRDALKRVASDAQDQDPLCDHTSVNDIDEIGRPLMPDGRRPYVNPLAGVATDYAGLDPFDICMPPAPRFNGALAAVEMAELYWMAVLRDKFFQDWNGVPDVQAAINELNALNADLGGEFALHRRNDDRTAWDPTIDLQTLFRGSAPGNDRGGYISQFLLRDVTFGTLDFEQTQVPPEQGQDYMVSADEWLAVQRGEARPSGRPDLEPDRMEGSCTSQGSRPSSGPPPCTAKRRHILNLRDLAHYVHFDALHEAYFNAALILSDLKVNLSYTNVYERIVSVTDTLGQSIMAKRRAGGVQEGFGTFGGPAVLVLVTEVATRALKAVWHQKWYVHRRLRPEASGARIHAALQAGASSDVQALAHLATLRGGNGHPLVTLRKVHDENGTYLLPMAFPEGSPMHPSYGAGHATVAGACVTVLKALFEPRFVFNEIADATTSDGGATSALTCGPNDLQLTVEGELNKLAANIAIGRNAAGVHYRTDYTKSLVLGEAVAVALLQEMAPTFAEGARHKGKRVPVWALPTFDGHWISIDCDGDIRRDIEPEPFAQSAPQMLLRSPATFAA